MFWYFVAKPENLKVGLPPSKKKLVLFDSMKYVTLWNILFNSSWKLFLFLRYLHICPETKNYLSCFRGSGWRKNFSPGRLEFFFVLSMYIFKDLIKPYSTSVVFFNDQDDQDYLLKVVVTLWNICLFLRFKQKAALFFFNSDSLHARLNSHYKA